MQTLKGHSACRIFIIFIFWPIHWYGVLETLNTHQKDIACDELLSDSFPCKELENGMLWEVQRKWVVQGAIDVDIGANPYAEGGCEDEGVDDQAIKIVDIVDTFRLQEQPAFDKK